MTDEEPVHLTARQARGGEIILRSRRRRQIFVAGLIGFVILAIVIYIARW